MPLSRFLKDRRGAVAPMFALAIIPMFGLVGAAVDYSRASAIKASMQAALDATSLAMAKLAPTLTESELQTKSTAYFNALFNNADAKNMTVTPTYTTSGGSQLTIAVSGSMDTAFMKLLGFSSLNVGSSSSVRWGNKRVRVALVLDNTGSMASAGKLGALKTATNDLLTQLKNASTTNGDVYVSIVPFVKDVNVGASNYNADWIDWSDWDEVNGSCSKKKHETKSDCTLDGKTWTAASHSTWNGCVVDRGNSLTPSLGNYDTNVIAPNGNSDRNFAAEQYGSCPQQILPLSYDWTAMKQLVDGMVAAGNTNQGIGLAHGWMSLVGGGPYPTPPAKDPNYQYSDIIILLTDGLNTQNRWYTSQLSIDARQQMTCDNAKAAGVVLYMVQVNTGSDPTSTLLQNCASDSGKFFLVTSSSGIGTVFNQIGTQLSQLRISK